MRRRTLRARCRAGAELLLLCRRFSTDALLIAADAFCELESELRLDGLVAQADEAHGLADALRTEAPRRLRTRACPIASLDRVA